MASTYPKERRQGTHLVSKVIKISFPSRCALERGIPGRAGALVVRRPAGNPFLFNSLVNYAHQMPARNDGEQLMSQQQHQRQCSDGRDDPASRFPGAFAAIFSAQGKSK